MSNLDPGLPTMQAWTPTLLGSSTPGSPTYALQQGYYSVVGNLCIAHFRLAISAVGGIAGNLLMGGLPKVAGATTRGCGGFSFWAGITLPANFTFPGLSIVAAAQQAEFWRSGSGQAANTMTGAMIDSGFDVNGTLIYRCVP